MSGVFGGLIFGEGIFGSADDTGGDVDPSIQPVGIASAEAFGDVALTTNIEPTGIASSESFGTPTLADLNIRPTGIGSGEVVGTPTIVDLNIRPTGIVSAEAFGLPEIADLNIRVTGIASEEAVGAPALEDHDIRVYGIASEEGCGIPALLTGDGTSFFINDTEVKWIESTFRITKTEGQASKATCDIIYKGGLRPEFAQDVRLFWKGHLRFGGRVLETSETNIPGNFDRSRMTIQMTGYDGILDEIIHAKKYTLFLGGIPGIVTYDIWLTKLKPWGVTYLGNTSGPGVGLGEITFHYESLRECFNKMLDKAPGWRVWIDDNKELQFKNTTGSSPNAPFSIVDDDGNVDKMTVIRTGTKKRNKQWVVPSKDVGGYFTDHYTSLAGETAFATSYPLNEKPRVKVNGEDKNVSELYAQQTGWEFYYIAGGIGVFPRYPLPAGLDIIILYPNPFPIGFFAEDTEDIGLHGLREYAHHAKNCETVQDAQALADGMLGILGAPSESVPKRVNYQYNEIHNDKWLEPSMVISVNRTFPDIDDNLAVESVASSEQADTLWRHDVVLRDSAGEVNESRIIDNFLVAQRGIINTRTIPATVQLDINGFGLVTGFIPDPYTCQNDGYLDNWDIIMSNEPPLGADVVIDVFLNGASLFSDSSNMVRCVAGSNVLQSGRRFNGENIRVKKGDQFTFQILQVGSTRTGRYGVVHINVKV